MQTASASSDAVTQGNVPAAWSFPMSAAEEFRQTVSENERALYARALVLTRHPCDARDIVQDTLLKGFRSLHLFEAGTNLRAWLMRIMMNLFIERCRRSSRRPVLVPLSDRIAESTPTASETDPPPRSASLTLVHLRAALDQLEPIFREPYELRMTRNMSYEQIASELGIPVATVGSRLSRGRQRLRLILTKQAQPVPQRL
jgi:RNA polymerase sigma-70 factor, ECF subfamily